MGSIHHLFGLLLLTGNLSAQPAAIESIGKSTPGNGLAWDATHKEARLNPGESKVTFTFNLTNQTSHLLTIERVDVSCGCTTVELPPTPWKLAPHDAGQLKVHFDAQGRTGKVIKNLLVHTSLGPRSLLVTAHLPANSTIDSAERLKNQQTAHKHRQTVFQGECAACHSAPAVNQTGEPLFVAACGICHAAEHRATMVPDLKTLKVTTSKAYWENWIRNGKPGSLMPAFEQKQGGPLTDAQVQSLVDFLSSNQAFSGSTNSVSTGPAH